MKSKAPRTQFALLMRKEGLLSFAFRYGLAFSVFGYLGYRPRSSSDGVAAALPGTLQATSGLVVRSC